MYQHNYVKKCGKCHENDANPSLFLGMYGSVCHTCFEKGLPPLKSRKRLDKKVIDTANYELDVFFDDDGEQ